MKIKFIFPYFVKSRSISIRKIQPQGRGRQAPHLSSMTNRYFRFIIEPRRTSRSSRPPHPARAPVLTFYRYATPVSYCPEAYIAPTAPPSSRRDSASSPLVRKWSLEIFGEGGQIGGNLSFAMSAERGVNGKGPSPQYHPTHTREYGEKRRKDLTTWILPPFRRRRGPATRRIRRRQPPSPRTWEWCVQCPTTMEIAG